VDAFAEVSGANCLWRWATFAWSLSSSVAVFGGWVCWGWGAVLVGSYLMQLVGLGGFCEGDSSDLLGGH